MRAYLQPRCHFPQLALYPMALGEDPSRAILSPPPPVSPVAPCLPSLLSDLDIQEDPWKKRWGNAMRVGPPLHGWISLLHAASLLTAGPGRPVSPTGPGGPFIESWKDRGRQSLRAPTRPPTLPQRNLQKTSTCLCPDEPLVIPRLARSSHNPLPGPIVLHKPEPVAALPEPGPAGRRLGVL